MKKYSPYTDQEIAPIEIIKLIAEYDISPSCEIERGAIFKTINNKYIDVVVSGCSCWPVVGNTEWSQETDNIMELESFFIDATWKGNLPTIKEMIFNAKKIYEYSSN